MPIPIFTIESSDFHNIAESTHVVKISPIAISAQEIQYNKTRLRSKVLSLGKILKKLDWKNQKKVWLQKKISSKILLVQTGNTSKRLFQ